MTKPIDALRALGTAHSGVKAGVACKGTAMERHTLKVKDKAFLFFGASDALVKLAGSLAEAKRLEKQAPEKYRAGANGWVKIMFSAEEPPALDVLERWIAESYATIGAVKKPAAKKPPARKPHARKPAAKKRSA